MIGIIGLEEGWAILEEGITKLRRVLDGCTETKFTAAEYMKYYECVYRMSSQRTSYCQELYDRYKLTLKHCIESQILTSLMGKHNEDLLQELVKAWLNYKAMVRVMSRFFVYIDRYHTNRSKLPSLNQVAINCFCNLVFPILSDNLIYAVNALIDREREGQRIDAGLLKNVVGFILDFNEEITNEFGQAIIDGASAYYSQKASEWISQCSLPDYLLKVEESLKRENSRLSHYFICISEHRRCVLLQDIKNQLLTAYQIQLINKQLNSNLLLHDNLTIEEELSARCTKLTLGDGKNRGAFSCMGME